MEKLKNAFADWSPFAKLMFTMFIAISLFMIVLVIGTALAIPIFNIGLKDVLTLGEAKVPNVNLLKYFQILQSIAIFIVPPFIVGYLFDTKALGYLKLSQKTKVSSLFFAMILVIVALPFINYLAELNTKMHLPQSFSEMEKWMRTEEHKAEELTYLLLKANSISGLLFNLFMIAVLPAVGEELLFRGVMQRIFSEWTQNVHIGIWISAALFSALHFQFLGFFPRLVLGVLFGYMLVWSGSLWLSISAHFVNNAFAVLMIYFYGVEIDKQMQSNSTVSNVSATFISAGLIAFFCYLIHNNSKNDSQV